MYLPAIQQDIPKAVKEILELRGINYSEQTADGDLADSLNISARRYPFLTTRRARVQQTAYVNASALTAWGKLVVIKNDGTAANPDYELYFDGTKIGAVSGANGGRKQFAVVNTRLVIWPDKKYLDVNERTIKPLAASVTATGATFVTGDNTAEGSVTLTGASDLTSLFKAGDGLSISGCTSKPENNKDFIVKGVTSNKLTVTANTFVAATESGSIKVERKIPDLDYICESENRLWGCSSETQTIYASALGDPTNFNVFENLSTDSYAIAVGSEGDFTGCCKLASSVLFWKETVLHKMLGSYPAEYQLYQYTVEGLRKGCHKSLQTINETLFYMGLHGVYAFAGGTPALISYNFGEKTFTDAVAGNDGDSYFLSCKDENDDWHLFVYETKQDIWIHEDNIECFDFARIGRDLYLLRSDGTVWLETGAEDDPNMEWMAQYVPFYEIAKTSRGGKTGTLERKRYSKLTLRFELPLKSYVRIMVRQDMGPWREIGQIVGAKNGTARVRIPITRCDRFDLKLIGKGPCALLDLERSYSLGSEV